LTDADTDLGTADCVIALVRSYRLNGDTALRWVIATEPTLDYALGIADEPNPARVNAMPR
jgi:hypothetical protein